MTDSELSFKNLEIHPYVDSSEDDFIEDFYIPLLSNSVEYKRGVGFFTSNWVQSAARGITALADNGGTAKWVVSPVLESEDWEAIKRGEQAKRNEAIRKALEQKITDLEEDIQANTRQAIAWMIYDGLLEIRLAVPKKELSGDFHDKFGIFRDEEGNKVAFHGSQNDSAKALENYESYDVFCDWTNESDAERVNWHEERFDELWDNNKRNVETYDVPRSVVEGIAELRSDSERPYTKPQEKEQDEADQISLRDYQREAVDAWFGNERQGMFEMATGTGKTFTAIGTMDRLRKSDKGNLAVVIAVPVTHLAEQWRKSLGEWGYQSAKFVYGSANPKWRDDLRDGFSDLNIGVRDLGIFITTHQTVSTEFFRETVEDARCNTLLIADEVHGMGSEKQRLGLSEDYDYRLGLSATPKRYYDTEGTSILQEFFGGVVFEFTLEDAIPEYLVPYEYYPKIVELYEDELDEYREFSKKLATEVAKENPDQERIEQLAIKRSRILKSADRKYDALREILDEIGEPDHLLVYTDPKQIDTAQDILNEHGIVQHKFTFEEGDAEREQLLADFGQGEYKALVAMRCLDEGVDVPSTRQAILMASSSNPKQFIQRRGRVLRHAPEKEKAIIHDMIVVPSLEPSRQIIESEKGILEKELKRFEEFAETALNETQARLAIQKLKTIYELSDASEDAESGEGTDDSNN